MAKESRRPIAWVSFCAPVRFSTQSASTPALATDEGMKLFKDDIDGLAHVIIEAASLPHASAIPWTNVASVGWLKT